jgi:Fic family protein
MLIPPIYELTPPISQLLSSIEASRAVIDAIPLQKELETNIRRKTTLKSSLFSARIEGNDLTLEEVEHSPSVRLFQLNVNKYLCSVLLNTTTDTSLLPTATTIYYISAI